MLRAIQPWSTWLGQRVNLLGRFVSLGCGGLHWAGRGRVRLGWIYICAVDQETWAGPGSAGLGCFGDCGLGPVGKAGLNWAMRGLGLDLGWLVLWLGGLGFGSGWTGLCQGCLASLSMEGLI